GMTAENFKGVMVQVIDYLINLFGGYGSRHSGFILNKQQGAGF
ncbi:MAG: hypothetical protein RLZZ148_563, partial [Cyanobacteriota bacterium]